MVAFPYILLFPKKSNCSVSQKTYKISATIDAQCGQCGYSVQIENSVQFENSVHMGNAYQNCESKSLCT